ncbi:MAG TPA: NFACT RNA binding domain-containing protein [Candidatus Limnocylindrales bacterium]|nr:NFACT RNA binding domain-containing protein [Candidatus Limnocylindrales bacterium]
MTGSRGTALRRYEKDGFEILVGKGAKDNDRLTFRVAAPRDLWLHASGYAGSHVVVRNPDRLAALPREVVEAAAQLAAHHSKARGARGKVDVHVCHAEDVRKPRGYPPGMVQLRRWESVKVYPRDPFADVGEP